MVLEDLYNSYVGTEKYLIKHEELTQTMDKIDTLLHNSNSLDETSTTTLSDLITEYKSIAQKQGFINGFKCAIQILKECM